MILDLKNYIEIILRVALAAIIGGIIGIEREYKNRPAGMRTHVLVALGAMSMALMEALISSHMFHGGQPGLTFSLGRISAQVVSGIGFLGAGTIFMSKRKIGGLTTAASLWCTACLGILIGFGFYLVAVIIFVMILLTLTLLQKIIHVNAIKSLEVKFTNRVETMQFINDFFESSNIKVLDIDFYVENADTGKKQPNIYRNVYTLKLPSNLHYTSIVVYLSEYANVQAVHTRNV